MNSKQETSVFDPKSVNLAQFTGTERYYRYAFGLYLTDGAKAFAEKFGAFWLLDIIGSYQPKVKDTFQVWYIAAIDNKGEVTCENGNGKKILSQNIEYTDFPNTDVKGSEASKYNTLWLVNDGLHLVVMLPSEY